VPARPQGSPFDYDVAFSRNVGFLSEWELQRLRCARVAIAGLGGAGGAHLLTLSRLGIGGFHIADFDHFALENFNRQVGATIHSIGRPKTEVMEDRVREINPEIDLHCFPNGIGAHNVDAFLEGVDLFVDGLDFFAPDIRALVFARARALGIPAVTAAPLGLGVTYLVFTPEGMSFEDYFGFEGRSKEQKLVNFLAGLSPRGLYQGYLVDRHRLDLGKQIGPSTPVAIQLCASVVGTEAFKLLLGRGRVLPAPWCHQFDPFEQRWVRTRVWGGRHNPRQMLKRAIGAYAVRRKHAGQSFEERKPSVVTPALSEMEQILDLGRWAPSGDNGQPWRFRIAGSDSITVLVEDEAAHDVYDFGGRPSLLSAGMLLETIRIAASPFGRGFGFRHVRTGPHQHAIHLELPRDASVEPNPLRTFIKVRSVDRRPYGLMPLTAEQGRTLEACLGEALEIRWFKGPSERLRCARLNARTSDLRLRVPEAMDVHERILDFANRLSPDGVASVSLGLDPLLHASLRWAMRKRSRQVLMTKVMGTGVPRLQMDMLPGIFCAAHYLVALRHRPDEEDLPEALLEAGIRLMRFWLTATSLGLAMQPAVAPLSFAFHAEASAPFTESSALRARAKRIAAELRALWPGHDSTSLVFGGRLGHPQAQVPAGRSIRKPLEHLLVEP
jgi:molybdopterin/thiamine biosynthesis adenylyltransferase/nitroreductase